MLGMVFSVFSLVLLVLVGCGTTGSHFQDSVSKDDCEVVHVCDNTNGDFTVTCTYTQTNGTPIESIVPPGAMLIVERLIGKEPVVRIFKRILTTTEKISISHPVAEK